MKLNNSEVAISKIARFNNDEIIYSYPAFPLEELFDEVDFDYLKKSIM